MPTGTNVPPGTEEKVKKLLPSVLGLPNMYLSTEFGTMIAFNPTQEMLGPIRPGIEVKILDVETGDILGPNKVGEILAKGRFMTPGYLNKPEANADLMTEDGFLRMGDLGHYDEEGMLYYDGRQKEVLRPYGINLFPVFMEEIIGRHPEVKEVAIFGRPDQVSC